MARKPRSLDEAVDQAIAEENRRFLSDPVAIAEARADGDRWRKQLEAEGILPPLEEPWNTDMTCGRCGEAKGRTAKWCPSCTDWQERYDEASNV